MCARTPPPPPANPILNIYFQAKCKTGFRQFCLGISSLQFFLIWQMKEWTQHAGRVFSKCCSVVGWCCFASLVMLQWWFVVLWYCFAAVWSCFDVCVILLWLVRDIAFDCCVMVRRERKEKGRKFRRVGGDPMGWKPDSVDRGEGGLGMCEVEMKGLKEDTD